MFYYSVFRALLLALYVLITGVALASDREEPHKMPWSFDGPFGKFDRASVQRGFQVYKEVCSVCHSVNQLSFRNLSEIGFTTEEIKSLAASYSVKDGPNDEGEYFDRPGRLSDHIPSPYANAKAASAANNGAVPPDLSLIIKAREDGANYVYALLTGYKSAPEGIHIENGMYYNPYFYGGGKQFAMPPPLVKEGQVTYTDGTKSTVEQMSRDVVNFLQWAAEPEMEQRKSLGIKSLIFLVILTVLCVLLKRKIWKSVK